MSYPVLNASNVSYGYGKKNILKNLTFTVYRHDKIALLGKNGSGKSTLIKGINRLLPIQSGELTIYRDLLRQEHESDIYTIFSQPDDQIILSTVYAEMALGLIQQGKTQDEIDRIIEQSLSRFGLLQYLHENPYHLSTGEKKKLLLSTALSLNPGLLILDEPFSGLDVQSKNELVEYIAAISCTQIIATHEYDYARRCCQKAFVLHNRGLTVFENLETILNDPALLHEYNLC